MITLDVLAAKSYSHLRGKQTDAAAIREPAPPNQFTLISPPKRPGGAQLWHRLTPKHLQLRAGGGPCQQLELSGLVVVHLSLLHYDSLLLLMLRTPSKHDARHLKHSISTNGKGCYSVV